MTTTHLPIARPGQLPRQIERSRLRTPGEYTTAVTSCHRCPLADERTQVVHGSGPADADIVLLGTAPGRQEDVQGAPFTGAAGNVIDNALAAAGTSRDEVALTTLVRCHPPSGRRPTGLELEACFPWFVEQVAMMQPRVLVTLGELPTSVLLRKRVSIGRVAGLRLTVWGDIVLLPTHDPLAALQGSARASASIRRAVATAVEVAGGARHDDA